jgi:integrase
MADPPKPLDRVREAIRTRHYSRRTEDAYVGWIRRSIRHHRKKHPAAMGAVEVNAFLWHLAVALNVSASTEAQALSALVFLYRHLLDDPLPWMDEIVRATRPHRLPVVLSREEVGALLANLQGTPLLVASLLYGGGLRLLEALRLRVKDVDFAANLLVVREGRETRIGGPCCRRACAQHSRRRSLKYGVCMPATSHKASATCGFPTLWTGSTRGLDARPPGSTSFRPRASPSTRGAECGAGITSRNPLSSGP